MRNSLRCEIPLMVGLFLAACGPSAEELAPTIVAQTAAANQTATAAVGGALSAALTELAPTLTATATPTPSFTPSLRPTATATPNPLAEVVVELGSIWSGPGDAYKIILNANQGDQLEAAGWSADGEWLVVLLDDGEMGCISADEIQIGEQGGGLPTVLPPPTATPAPRFSFTIAPEFGVVQLTVLSTGASYKTSSTTPITFTIEGGWQTLTYTWNMEGGVSCRTTMLIDRDIHWAPPRDAALFCGSLPGGTNV
jgi:hypothetical protein